MYFNVFLNWHGLLFQLMLSGDQVRMSVLCTLPFCSFAFTDCARQAVKCPWLEAFRDLARQGCDLLWHWQQFCPGWDAGLEGRCGYLLTKLSVVVSHILLCDLTAEVTCSLFLSRACRFYLQYLF